MYETEARPEVGISRQSRNAGRGGMHGLCWTAGQVLGLLLLLTPLCGSPGRAQNPSFPSPSSTQGSAGQRIGNPDSPFSEVERDPFQDERRLKALNAARQKALVSDTEKLLRLATELHDEIAARNDGLLTEAQFHKLGEIEKLARSVKEKMSSSVRGVPVYPAAHPLQYP